MSANNVFVSYKYHDSDVKPIGNRATTVRDYVDHLERIFDRSEKVYYRGEEDGNDLSDLTEDTVRQILSNKIFYTTVTVVLMSPNMYDMSLPENKQWIPWEISYSLKNKTRSDGSSNMNAILAVVLPDRNGSYDYAMYSDGRRTFVREKAFFEIILANIFNRRGVDHFEDRYGNPMYVHGNSYIALARWSDFRSNPEHYIDLALRNRGEWDRFDIVKRIDDRWVS